MRAQKKLGESPLTGVELDVYAAVVSTSDSLSGRCDVTAAYLCTLANCSREGLFRALRRLGDGRDPDDRRGERTDARVRVRRRAVQPVGLLHVEWQKPEYARCELSKRDCDRLCRLERLPGCEFHHGRIVIWLRALVVPEVARALAELPSKPLRRRASRGRPVGWRSAKRAPCATSATASTARPAEGPCDTSHSVSVRSPQGSEPPPPVLCDSGVAQAAVAASRPVVSVEAVAPAAPVVLVSLPPQAQTLAEGTARLASGAPAALAADASSPLATSSAGFAAEPSREERDESNETARAPGVPSRLPLHAAELAAIAGLWGRVGLSPMTFTNRKALANRHAEDPRGVASLEQLRDAVYGARFSDHADARFARERAESPAAMVFGCLASVAKFAHLGREQRKASEESARRRAVEAERDRVWRETAARAKARERAERLAPGELARELALVPPPAVAPSAAEVARRKLEQLEVLFEGGEADAIDPRALEQLARAAARGIEPAGELAEVRVVPIAEVLRDRERKS